MQPLGWLCPEACPPLALVEEAAFLVLETVWVSVWEGQLRMAILLQGIPGGRMSGGDGGVYPNKR